MAVLGKIFKSLFDKLGRRYFEAYVYGPMTAQEAGPWGSDGCPPQGMDAICLSTGTDDEQVIVGYMNLNQLAQPGEKRLFATSAEGKELKTYLWLKNDGTIEFAGNTDNLVRYKPLDSGLQESVNLVNAELAKIQVAITSLGGAYAKQEVSLNIDSSKIDEFKTL